MGGILASLIYLDQWHKSPLITTKPFEIINLCTGKPKS